VSPYIPQLKQGVLRTIGITKYEFMFCTALWLLISNLLITFGFDLSFNQVIFGGLIYLGILSIGYPFVRYKYQNYRMTIDF